jgi:hypothetical protein
VGKDVTECVNGAVVSKATGDTITHGEVIALGVAQSNIELIHRLLVVLKDGTNVLPTSPA